MAARKSELIITCNAKGVENVMRILDERLKGIKQQLQTLNNYGSKHGWTDDMKKDFKELTEEAAGIDTIMKRNQQTMRKYGEVMKDLAGSKLKDLKKALQEGKAALNNMSERDPKRKQLVDDLKRIEAQINKNTGATNKMTGAQKGFSSAIASTAKNLATYMIGFAGFNKVKSLVEDVFRSNLKLSDSLANIRKVSGLSGEAINELYRNISKIDSRNTIETLNQLAYTGAKLGIGQNYGVEGLTGFVKAAEQVQMALGEDMGEKALPDLSKMVEVMGLIPKYGVEQSMQKAASAIFQLGATSTATGTNIVEFSKRLYGLANVSRISTQDLLALGSASDAMGLMPEVSATAFNKLFTSIQRQHNLIEQSLGMTKGTIKQYYDQGKTMDAIVEIFERMNQKGNLNLLGSIFKDFGSDGARLVNVMATMADRADILRKHLQTSRDAFKEGEAVIGEYMIQNQTAAALVERASNLWAKAFTNPEGVDMVKEMAQAWYDLSKQMTQSEALMGSLHTSIELIAGAISTLIKLFPVLIRFGIIFATTFGFKGLIAGIGGLVTAFRTLYKDIALATGAMGKFNVMMKSNAILFAISSLITAITLFNDYSKAAEEAAKREAERQAKLKAAFEESKESVQNVVKPLERYKRILEEGNLSEKQKAEVIKELNNKYQEYLDYLGIEIKSAADLAKAYAKVVEIMKIKKAYEERESFRQQKNGDNRMSRIENQAKVEAAARSFGLTDVDKQFLEKNQHLGTAQLYRQLIEKKMGAKAVSQDDEDVTFIYIDDKLVNAGTQFGPRAKKRYKKVGSEELYDAINDYISSFRSERNTNKEIDAMFDSEYSWTDKNGKKRKLSEFDIDEYNDTVQKAVYKRKGSLENEKPDKAAIAAAKKAEAERKKALRAEMKDEQQQAKAIIDNVKNYYQRQLNAITEMANLGTIDKTTQEQMTDGMTQRMNTALANVRKAIGGTENDWEEFKKSMREDLYEPLGDDGKNFSTELLDKVLDNNLVKLREMIQVLSKELNQQGSVLLDQILRKATENEGRNTKIDNKLMRAREKELLERNYTGKVDLDYQNTMEQFGIGGITTEQSRYIRDWSQKDDKQNIKKFFDDRTKLWQQGFEQARKNIIDLYRIDIEKEGGVNDLMELLYGKDYKNTLQGSALEGLLNMDASQWRIYYMKLIEYNDQWIDAQKKAYDEHKKREDYLFKNRPDVLSIDTTTQQLSQLEQQRNLFGQDATFGRQMGMVDTISNDPELMRYDLLQARAEMYYNKMYELRQQDLISEQQLKDAREQMTQAQINMQQKLMEAIQSRTQTIQNAIQPITDFAENAGQKLGDMMFNMESQSMTWNQIWKNMLLAMGKSIIQMGQQYAIQKLQRSLFNKQVEADEEMHQALLTAIAIGGAIARTTGELQIENGALVAKKVINGQEVTEEISLATILTALGISKGAAKTIGALGWLGIPLIAVISSLLMGLLTSALSTAGAESAGSSSSTAATPKTKLVSGMLTYDRGNVDKFAGRRKLYDDGTTQVYGRRRYLGEDGKVYTATAEPAPKDGLITHPIATTVQGQPALVAENGPEIVIGRETTKAIMMNEPELIKYLANYQQHGGSQGYSTARGLAAYDSGNVNGQSSMVNGQPSDVSPQTSDAAAERQALINRLDRSDALMEQVLYFLQNPIAPEIAMYDTGGKKGLRSKMKEADRFMARYGG